MHVPIIAAVFPLCTATAILCCLCTATAILCCLCTATAILCGRCEDHCCSVWSGHSHELYSCNCKLYMSPQLIGVSDLLGQCRSIRALSCTSTKVQSPSMPSTAVWRECATVHPLRRYQSAAWIQVSNIQLWVSVVLVQFGAHIPMH